MISSLRGIVFHKDLKYAVIDVKGVGYKVNLNNETLNSLRENDEAVLWIHTTVKEDAIDLYGFKNKEDLDFFELLITISGIGPKSALGVLNSATVSSLVEAISTGETAYLTKISGIGKKVADKIVLELKGKISGISGDDKYSGNASDIDALEALKALGYTHKEARESLEEISRDIKDPGEKVRAALKKLGKN